MITNEEGMAEGVEYLSPLGKSDHRVINFNLKCYIQQTKRIKEIYYHGKGNYTNMGLELMKINWNEELGNREEDVNYQWHFIKEKIELAMEKHVLKWKIKIGHTKHKCKLQHKCKLNNETRELIRRKHKAWQRYAESHYTDENKLMMFQRLRNKVSEATRYHQKRQEREIANEPNPIQRSSGSM